MDDPASLFTLAIFAEPEIANQAPTLGAALLRTFLVIVLVLANGFFVAAEFAFVGVRRSRIETLASEGNVNARRLLGILDSLNAYLSASQLGITLASLGLGALGEPLIEALLGGWLSQWFSDSSRHIVSYFIGFVIITALHITVGEQAPKLVGLQIAEKFALATALPMHIFYKIFKLPIRLLDTASAKLVNIVGLRADADHASVYTEDEIRQLINVSHKSGHLNEEEQKLINKVFEFSETTVKEAMVPRTAIVAISDTCTLDELAREFRKHGYSRLPVYHDSLDDIVGVIHSKDVMSYLVRPKTFQLDRVIRKPNYVVDTAKLEDVLRQMQSEKFHFGFVVDEHGGVEGIITLEDLLEEIVGDISDEHDEEVNEQIREQADGSFILDGGLAVRDLNRRLGLNVPLSDGYTTVAGFLMSAAGELLDEGDTVSFNGHRFVIEKVDRRRITRVRMEKAPDLEGETQQRPP
jgi:CBS domain containing-hemolysin-like protein